MIWTLPDAEAALQSFDSRVARPENRLGRNRRHSTRSPGTGTRWDVCDRGLSRRLVTLAFVAAMGGASPCAAESADDSNRGAARDLGYQGVAAFQSGDYEGAISKLEKAYRALPAPS